MTTDENARLRATNPAVTAFVVVLIVAGLNLRPAITTLTAALDEVVAAYGLNGFLTSVLVSLPVVVFAVGVPIGPWLAARVGMDRAIVLLSVLLAVAMVVRPFSTWLLFLGTAVAALGITGVSVLAAAVFRRGDQHTAAKLTSSFTAVITSGAAVGALLVLPLLGLVGDSVPTALLLWALPAVVAAFALALTSPGRGTRAVVQPDPVRMRAYLRYPATWALVCFFGLQSAVFYGMTAWLPTMLRDRGLGAQDAALVYVAVSLLGLVGALVAPRVAVHPDRRVLVVLTVASATLAGWLGLAWAPTGTRWIWALLLGVSQGAGFALGLSFVVFRALSPAQAASLSAVVQGVGYAIAALGPLVMGLVLDLTGTWFWPVVLLATAAAVEGVTGVRAAADRPVIPRRSG